MGVAGDVNNSVDRFRPKSMTTSQFQRSWIRQGFVNSKPVHSGLKYKNWSYVVNI